MDFDTLPNDAFLKIVQYLPFKEQCRLRRVNKRFYEISDLALSKMKIFELNEITSDFVAVTGLSHLLDLCSSNLEQIILRPRWNWPIIYKTLSNYSFPQLTEFEDKRDFDCSQWISIMIAQCPNLRKLTLRRGENFRFPDNYVATKLESLAFFRSCSNEAIQSLIGKVPNLKEFSVSMKNIIWEHLDNLFATIPFLEHLEVTKNEEMPELEHFWRLNQLNHLRFEGFTASNADLEKISVSFPLMVYLTLKIDRNVSGRSVGALGSLKHLSMLCLTGGRGSNLNLDADGIESLIGSETLTELRLDNFTFSPTQLVNFIRFCPKLSYLKINMVSEITEPEMAVVVLESLSDVGGEREIKLWMRRFFLQWGHAVDSVSGLLKEAGGPEITVTGGLFE